MSNFAAVESKYSRNISLDVLRVTAILSVVMIHCSSVFVNNFKDNAYIFLAGNVADSVSRAGVPLFLMISGALMLDKNKEKSSKDMFNAAKNLLILAVIWELIYSAIYNIIFPVCHGDSVSLTKFFKSAVEGHYHLWYLYMQAGLYIITPFLKKFVTEENKELVLLYIAIALCTTFMKPAINFFSVYRHKLSYISGFIDKFYMDFFGPYITYYLTGWYIVHIGVNKKRIRTIIYAMGAASVSLVIFLTQITGEYKNTYSIEGIFVFIYAVSIFLLVNNIRPISSHGAKKCVLFISKLSFGVYLIHEVINHITGEILAGVINPLIHIPLKYAIVVSASLLISYAISKVPGLKKLIRT